MTKTIYVYDDLVLLGRHELVGPGDVVLAQLHQEGCQEAWLTVCGGEDVSVRDEDPATLVLSEESQPGALLHQDLPRPVSEG